MLRVAHIVTNYLPKSETFIYQFIIKSTRTEPIVLCGAQMNADLFPVGNVVATGHPSVLHPARLASRFLKVTGLKPYAHPLAGRFRAALEQIRPDVVHAHFGPNGVLVEAACRELGLPLIVGFLGYDFSSRGTVNAYATAYRQLFQTCRYVTALSQYAIDRVVELGCPREKLVLIRAGIDVGQFRFRKAPAHRSPIRFLGIGRMVEKKGTRYALEAIASLRERLPEIQYIHIGSGELETQLKQHAARLGITDICDFRGAVSHRDVSVAVSESDVLLMPSITAANGDVESQGVALQEAQAVGVPVIATRHNGFPEGMKDGVTGFLVPERDVPALTAAMFRLATDPGLRASMGGEGRRFVEEHFDVHKEARKLDALYEQCLAKDTHPGNRIRYDNRA